MNLSDLLFQPEDQIHPDAVGADITNRLSVCPQMSNYKRATLDEEEVSDVAAEAASSPDRVEVSECSMEWDGVDRF